MRIEKHIKAISSNLRKIFKKIKKCSTFSILFTIYYYKNKKVNFIIIMAKLPNGFKCDREQKQLVKALIVELFKNYDIIFDEENDKNEYADIDILFTAYTKDGYFVRRYAMEIKQRLYNYTAFNGDWFIEVKKYNNLLDYQSSGYTGIYLNTFNDNTFVVWDIKDIVKNHKEGDWCIKPHTQASHYEKPVTKHRYTVNVKNAKLMGKFS